jgi:glycosyltransferase involved in cell wall biosynthesis
MKLTIIIPVYNEAGTVETLVDMVLAVPLDKEVIVVDDGSTDGSRQIILNLQDKHPRRIQALVKPQNQGKGSAIRTALLYARGDVVIIQDADLELSPQEYIQLITPFNHPQTQVVYGSRFLRHNPNISTYTRVTNRLLAGFTNLFYGSHLTDEATSYKLFRRELLNSFRLASVGFEFCPEVTAKTLRKKIKIIEIPISYTPRLKSQGKKVTFWDGLRAVWTLFKYRIT